MKTIKSLLIISLLALMTSAFAQNVIEGTVYEEVDGKRQPLPGVNVYWKIANVGTVTDEQGHYSLEIHPTYKCLVFSFVGYLNDTVHHMAKPQHYDHVMSTPVTLSEVEIARALHMPRNSANTGFSLMKPFLKFCHILSHLFYHTEGSFHDPL